MQTRIGTYGREFVWAQPKPRTWHDPARKAAADLRQAKRRERNLRHAGAGAYGTHWQAS